MVGHKRQNGAKFELKNRVWRVVCADRVWSLARCRIVAQKSLENASIWQRKDAGMGGGHKHAVASVVYGSTRS